MASPGTASCQSSGLRPGRASFAEGVAQEATCRDTRRVCFSGRRRPRPWPPLPRTAASATVLGTQTGKTVPAAGLGGTTKLGSHFTFLTLVSARFGGTAAGLLILPLPSSPGHNERTFGNYSSPRMIGFYLRKAATSYKISTVRPYWEPPTNTSGSLSLAKFHPQNYKQDVFMYSYG